MTEEKRSQRSNVKAMSLLRKSRYSWKIFFFRRSILVGYSLITGDYRTVPYYIRGTINSNKFKFVSPWLPDIICGNTDLHYHVRISVIEAQISPLQNILRGSWSCKLLHLSKGGGDSRRQLKFSLCGTRRDSCVCRLRRTRLTHQNNSSRDCSLFLNVM